jgi:hypothetical protein
MTARLQGSRRGVKSALQQQEWCAQWLWECTLCPELYGTLCALL